MDIKLEEIRIDYKILIFLAVLLSQVFELTEKVSELISSWPEKWGDYRDENAIGVLTPYADQVSDL